MTITDITPSPATDEQRRTALAERLFASISQSVQLLTVELGQRLGLYEALHGARALTPVGLAEAAAIHPRYAREWLEQQAVSGWIDLTVHSDDPDRRAYSLPAPHADVLLGEEHPAYTAPATAYLVGLAGAIEPLVEAYRTGGGVPDAAYGGFGCATARWSRPLYTHALHGWLDALPDITERLAAGGLAVDIGCGHGFAAIALARAFPSATVVGVDIDETSVATARANAAAAGIGDRVQFLQADAAALDPVAIGRADLVTIFESLHDMGDPVAALRAVHGLLQPIGALLVADEKVGEEFRTDVGPYEQMMFCMSVLHCLPATRAAGTVVDAGTVLRPSTVRAYATAAGFSKTEIVPIEVEYFHFYRLHP